MRKVEITYDEGGYYLVTFFENDKPVNNVHLYNENKNGFTTNMFYDVEGWLIGDDIFDESVM